MLFLQKLKISLHKFVNYVWYKPNWICYLFVPFMWLYCLVIFLRKWLYTHDFCYKYRSPIPIIVVGNITVGGTGKTPLVIWLAEFLRQNGLSPAIISRGYESNCKEYPHLVADRDSPEIVGDEAVLLKRRSACKVMIGPNRVSSVKSLLTKDKSINVIISDDGLQHYALERDINIIVLDGKRLFGNNLCLPAGPMRMNSFEINMHNQQKFSSTSKEITYLVINNRELHQAGSADIMGMKLIPDGFYVLQTAGKTSGNMTEGRRAVDKIRSGEVKYVDKNSLKINALQKNNLKSIEELRGLNAHAVTGIGNPGNFFYLLKKLGMNITKHAFPDHHIFQEADLAFNDALPIIMTEKDATKCRKFASKKQILVLRISAQVDVQLGNKILEKL